MNCQVQVHLDIPEVEMHAELVAELVAEISDVVVKKGLGNTSENDGEVTCFIVVKGQETEDVQEFLTDAVKGAWAVSVPTNDPVFLKRTLSEGFESE